MTINHKNPIILLIDDDIDELEMISLLFKEYPISLHYAANAEDALKMALEIKPDLILLDNKLVLHDAKYVLEQMRGLVELASIPCYVISGDMYDQLEQTLLSAGASGVFKKRLTDQALEIILTTLGLTKTT